MFGAASSEQHARHPNFRVPRFTRTISQWVNALLDAGFVIERLQEPCPNKDLVTEEPRLQDASVVAYFLHV